mmetsp:Transcript_16040/g.24164  ORF Transcript_16040/g.24164 Transcript_16040/m.24164 type:complete len:475 (+) Transcript_16040:70-1494(+)
MDNNIALLLILAASGCALLLFNLVARKQAPPQAEAPKSKKKSKKKRSKKKKEAAKKEPVEQAKVAAKGSSKAEAKSDIKSVPTQEKKESGKLSRNQRRKRNARARLEAKAKEEKEQKLAEKLSSSSTTKPKTSTSQKKKAISEKQKAKEARARYLQAQRDLAEGWQTVGADKKLKPKKQTPKKKKEEKKEEKPEVKGPSLVTARLEVDPRHYGKIIGSAGATLKALMAKTETAIRLPPRGVEPPSKTIVIEGTGDAVGLAKSAIHELVHKGYSRLLNPEIAEGAVSIDRKLHGLVIGPKGSVINAIKKKTGVQINLPGPNTTSRRITLTGSKNGIKAAKQAIKFIANYRYTPLLNPTWTHIEMEVPPEKMGKIIGSRASTRRHIEGNTKAKIHTPMRGDENQNVIVYGPLECVKRAEKAINKILNKEEEEYEEKSYKEEADEDEEESTDPIAAQYLVDTSKPINLVTVGGDDDW